MNIFIKKENVRRKHNYLPLIIEVLRVLAEEGKLSGQITKAVDKQKAKKTRSIK